MVIIAFVVLVLWFARLLFNLSTLELKQTQERLDRDIVAFRNREGGEKPAFRPNTPTQSSTWDYSSTTVVFDSPSDSSSSDSSCDCSCDAGGCD
jgi:hypothetical protein